MPVPLLAMLGSVGLAADGVKSLGGAALGTAKAFTGLPYKVEAFADSLMAGSEAMRAYSGTVDAAFSKLEMNQRRRDFAKANVLSPETAGMVRAVDSLKDSLLPLQVGVTKMTTLMTIQVTSMLTKLTEMAKGMPILAKLLEDIEKDLKENKGTPTAAVNFLNEIQAGRFTGGPARRREREALGDQNPADVNRPIVQFFPKG